MPTFLLMKNTSGSSWRHWKTASAHRKTSAVQSGFRTQEDICREKQLPKILNELIDEGYSRLNEKMEAGFSCETRLRAFIRDAGADPFPIENFHDDSAY